MLSAEEEEEEGLGEPLILRIDQDDQGSVGSEDTSRFDSDDDVPPAEAGEDFLLHLWFDLLPEYFQSLNPRSRLVVSALVCKCGSIVTACHHAGDWFHPHPPPPPPPPPPASDHMADMKQCVRHCTIQHITCHCTHFICKFIHVV